jgi:hypothetical protein
LKLWLFEELLAFIYFQLNAFANCWIFYKVGLELVGQI